MTAPRRPDWPRIVSPQSPINDAEIRHERIERAAQRALAAMWRAIAIALVVACALMLARMVLVSAIAAPDLVAMAAERAAW